MKEVKVGKSKIHGKGLFSKEPIKKGDLITKVHAAVKINPELTKFIPNELGKFYNHTDKIANVSNEIIGDGRYLRALKSIPANTELAADYREHSEMEQPEDFDKTKYASFDYDDTFTTPEGLAKAKELFNEGYNLFIISARDEITPEMVLRAQEAGIPRDNIIVTGSDEAKVAKVKALGIQKHFDNKSEVINQLGELGEQFRRGGIKSKKYTSNLLGKNRLFVKNGLLKKKSVKNKIYDPNSPYFKKGGALLTKKVTCKKCGWKWDAADGGNDMTTCHKCGGQGLIHAQSGGLHRFVKGGEPENGIITQEEIDAANTAMMKARLAYANEFGNPAAKRMINIPDNPYQFDNGDTGTHYMASMDNYAVPQIQDENGVLQLRDYGPESNEAIRFDSDEDANYFAEHYKDVSPGFINEKKKGGALNKFIEGGPTDCDPGYYWNGKACVKDYGNPLYQNNALNKGSLIDQKIKTIEGKGMAYQATSDELKIFYAQRAQEKAKQDAITRKAANQKKRDALAKQQLIKQEFNAQINPNKTYSETVGTVAGNAGAAQTQGALDVQIGAKQEYHQKRKFVTDNYLNTNREALVNEAARSIQNSSNLTYEQALEQAKQNEALLYTLAEKHTPTDSEHLTNLANSQDFYDYKNSRNDQIKSIDPTDPTHISFENTGTLEGYMQRAKDIVFNPLDAVHYAMSNEKMPYNFSEYEKMKQQTGYRDGADNNAIMGAIDFASWFHPVGLYGQGMKMIEPTAESILNVYNNPTWENAGNAAFDVGMNALTFLGAKNPLKFLAEEKFAADAATAFRNWNPAQSGPTPPAGPTPPVNTGTGLLPVGVAPEVRAASELAPGTTPLLNITPIGFNPKMEIEGATVYNKLLEQKRLQDIAELSKSSSSSDPVAINLEAQIAKLKEQEGKAQSSFGVPNSITKDQFKNAGNTDETIFGATPTETIESSTTVPRKNLNDPEYVDDEVVANIIDDMRVNKMELWETAEGKARLQKMIDNTESLKSNNVTPELIVERKASLNVTNRIRLNSENKLKALDEEEDLIDSLYDDGHMDKTDWMDRSIDIEEARQAQNLIIDGVNERMGNSSAFYSNRNIVGIRPKDYNKNELDIVTAHELGHFLGEGHTTYLDDMLNDLTLIDNTSAQLTIPGIGGGTESKAAARFGHDRPNYLEESLDYFKNGSEGTEKVPFLSEVRQVMLKDGTIKNEYDKITPDMLKKHYEKYKKNNDEKYPIRLYDILKDDKKNFTILSKVLDNLPIVLQAVGMADALFGQEDIDTKEAGFSILLGAITKGKGKIKNRKLSKLLSRELNKNNLPKPIYLQTLAPKLDPIARSTVNKENDFIDKFGKKDYKDFVSGLYQQNRTAYDNPIINFKSSKPTSKFPELGLPDKNKKSPYLFKDKYCKPGSPCAKTSNAVTNKVYTDITGDNFATNENAHNAWHLEDQITRHGGKNVTQEQLKVGDRILIGNGVNESTTIPGYTEDPAVRHAAFFAGYYPVGKDYVPMLFESGRQNPMYMSPVNQSFVGNNTVKQIIRSKQFLGDTFGEALVDKNIRYAYRDKPSVATYTSNNKTVQSLITDAEPYRDVIKKTYDITNDEFDELLTSLIGIGAQETKLGIALSGSFPSKVKIKTQDYLESLGLSKPIKQTLNTYKNVVNKVTSKSSLLPPYPGTSYVEMESAKLASELNIDFKEALNIVKAQYKPQSKKTLSTVEPSKGIFRQKFQTDEGKLAGFNELKGIDKEELGNGMTQMAENYIKIKKTYPDADPRKLIDLTVLMWNSPGKAKNKELVDFYLFGKGNPDVSKFKFDYINKVNKYKDELINIHPQSSENYFEFLRGSYPEIQYKEGGQIDDYFEIDIPKGDLQKYLDQGYNVQQI